MPETMKAAVVHAFDQPLRIEEVLACPPRSSPPAVRGRCDHGRDGHGREAEHAGADHR
jgi:hypothetical protein